MIVVTELWPVCDLWFSDLQPFFPLKTTRHTCLCADQEGIQQERGWVCVLGRGELCLVSLESVCHLGPQTSSKNETWVLMSKENRIGAVSRQQFFF